MFYQNFVDVRGLAMRSLSTIKSCPEDLVICLHGWLDNVGSFVPLFSQAPKVPWYALDLIGHGQSQWRPETQYYYFNEYVNDLMLFINSHPEKRIHLIGHSLGAAIASIVSGLLPERIVSCVLIDALGPLVNCSSSIAEHWRLSLHQYQTTRPIKYYPSKDILVKARKKKHLIEESSCQLLVDYGTNFDNQSSQYSWSFDPRLFHLSPLQMTQEQVLSILSHVQSPTLFIKADKGYPFSDLILQERLAVIENLSCATLPGGHHVHMDSPEKVWQVMVEFYQEHNIRF